MAWLKFARLINYRKFFALALGSKGKPWRKALFLDLFLHDFHIKRLNQYKSEFSTIFFNAGAHIQHHYFFNFQALQSSKGQTNPQWYVSSEFDPVAEMLEIYDRIIMDYLSIDVELILATGLSQCPFDRLKLYYRIKNHEKFLRMLNIFPTKVQPRMTRDFLIEFSTDEDARIAERKLRSICVDSSAVPLFGELDNRGKSLFVTLTYPNEVTNETVVIVGEDSFPLKPYVAFVAIKNGMHQSKGFAFFSDGVSQYAPEHGAHVQKLHDTVLDYFNEDLS